MFRILANWYQKRFSDPDAVTLFLLLLLGFITLYFFSHLVGPILVALVLAYLLEWPTQRLIRIGCPRSVATVVCCASLSASCCCCLSACCRPFCIRD